MESEGEPSFHTFAIVPINSESEVIMVESITTENFQVEQAIYNGLIAMDLEEQFDKLTQFF